MKIAQIDVYLTRFPFRSPFRWADKMLEAMQTVLLRLTDADGNTGWGEVFPGNQPMLTSAWSLGVFYVLKECILPSLGPTPAIDSGESLREHLKFIRGNQPAKGVLDLAFWDLYAKRQKKPLHTVIGGDKKEIEVGVIFDRYEALSPFIDHFKEAVAQKYKRITLKMRPGWDLQILGIARNEAPLQMLQCDVEGVLEMDRHSDILYRFDDFFPSLLEQPLSISEFVGHAMLQDRMRTSIGLDESISTFDQAEIAIDLRSANTFCLKPGRVGGITEAKLIHDASVASEITCYSGCDGTTSIGYRFVAALAALPGFTLPADYLRTDELLLDDPGIPLKPVLKPDVEGQERQVIELWDEPGIGMEPDMELIERNLVQKFTWPV
ncbi:MAG: enolase C-terminal domain-like protein [Thermoguttaceae bacterium]